MSGRNLTQRRREKKEGGETGFVVSAFAVLMGVNHEFSEVFLTAENSKSAKIRGQDRSMSLRFLNISVSAFFEFFAVQSIWLRLRAYRHHPWSNNPLPHSPG
jgi:hypothetical protein